MLQATDHDPLSHVPFAHCGGNQQVKATPSLILKQQWRHGQGEGKCDIVIHCLPLVFCN
jgi:hypothetical protein